MFSTFYEHYARFTPRPRPPLGPRLPRPPPRPPRAPRLAPLPLPRPLPFTTYCELLSSSSRIGLPNRFPFLLTPLLLLPAFYSESMGGRYSKAALTGLA
jgi:hypothetical protein